MSVGLPRAADAVGRALAPALIDSLPDALLAVAPSGSVVCANPAAEHLLGASAAQLAAAGLAVVVPFDSPLVALIEQARRRDALVTQSDAELRGPRLGIRRVDMRACPIAEMPGVVLVSLREHPLARRLGRETASRDAAHAVSALAATLAHEVKNPLSAIRGAAQLIAQDGAPAERELAEVICEEAERIRALVARVEAFGDAPAGSRHTLNIHEVLDYVRRPAVAGLGPAVRRGVDYDPSLPPVWGNRSELVQVFQNLLRNAAEALGEGEGSIVIATQFDAGLRLAAGGARPRAALPILVSIADDGPGIPEALRAHVFEPFVSGRRAGTGLGLALAAKIVHEHGGALDFESEPGRTVFRVRLPTAEPARAAGRGAGEP